jgi:LruC domain-containing protein
MKKIVYLFSMVVSLGLASAAFGQVTLNCESGNRAIEQGNCWGFGAISYSNTANYVISGVWSTKSNSLTNPAPTACWIKTPWMLVGSGDITFRTRLDGNSNGVVSKGIIISYIPYDANNAPNYEGTAVQFYTYSFPNFTTTIRDISAAIPAEIANATSNAYKIRVSFVGTGGNERAYADDFVFPGTYWSNPANGCIPLTLIQDTDNDGVADADDAYPTDPYRAYNSYYPAQNQYGTLAFEDNWPNRADYDFNDVVVNYNMKTVTNASNQVVEIKSVFVARASGASFQNAFGFQLDNIALNKVISVTGNHISPSTIFSLSPNGLEANQNYANCIVFDNFYNVMAHPGVGTGINTVKTAPEVPYDTLNVTITFMQNGIPASGGAINISQLPASAFNFYIVANQERGREIHLADFVPTYLANTSLFGTGNDNTTPSAGIYYKSSNNLPWGLNILTGFDYPIEIEPINEAYLHFVEWAGSSGVNYPDWYTNQQGYRDESKIY